MFSLLYIASVAVFYHDDHDYDCLLYFFFSSFYQSDNIFVSLKFYVKKRFSAAELCRERKREIFEMIYYFCLLKYDLFTLDKFLKAVLKCTKRKKKSLNNSPS